MPLTPAEEARFSKIENDIIQIKAQIPNASFSAINFLGDRILNLEKLASTASISVPTRGNLSINPRRANVTNNVVLNQNKEHLREAVNKCLTELLAKPNITQGDINKAIDNALGK